MWFVLFFTVRILRHAQDERREEFLIINEA